MDFIGKYYTDREKNIELIKYKQSDGIIDDINRYVEDVVKHARVINDFTENKIYTVYKDELNDLLHNRYNTLPFFERVDINDDNATRF